MPNSELIGYDEEVLATLYNIEDHRPAYCDVCGSYHGSASECNVCGDCTCDGVIHRYEDGEIKLPCDNDGCDLEHYITEDCYA